mmetsp:Transcript_67325/g.213041  ORF Transcript_67325/g.213041 Transcript_67325/m.213041 type:complete len:196 (-) Transcript_67325:79-666(-)
MPRLRQRERKRDDKLRAAAAALPSGGALPITLGRLTGERLRHVSRLHQTHLGIDYSDEYFRGALLDARWTRVALWGELVVGAVICKEIAREGPCLHVRSIIAAVPRCRIGTRLLRAVLAEAETRGISKSSLHVHVRNDAAIALYRSLGYLEVETLVGYYRASASKLEEPPDALLMIRDARGQGRSAAEAAPEPVE